MARVVVIGGGFGGMAAAARLAKLGHDVTLLERSAQLGGALTSVEQDGFTWDAGPTSTLLPAVIRDLFRKSGRPLEREVDLQPLDLVREHRFADGTSLQLPGASRAAQLAAVDGLGPGLGQQWVDHVASYGETWELLRKEWFERPFDEVVAPRELTALLGARESLEKRLRRVFRDERLRLVAGHRLVMDGHALRDVPVFAGVDVYLEQRFGAWTVPGGLATLGTAMAERLALRGVTVLTGTPATDLVVSGGRVSAVRTDRGELPADHVVVAIDPRRLPALASYVRRTMPAFPPVVCHIGLQGDVPDLPHEVVLHGEPLLVVRDRGPRSRRPRRLDGAGAGHHRRGRADRPRAPRPRRPQAGRHPGRPQPARPRRAVGRFAARCALAGSAHGAHPAGPADPDRRGAHGRCPRHDRLRTALRRPQCRARRGGRRPGLTGHRQ